MSLLFKLKTKYELRGSVSFIPYKDEITVEFFKSNTRISKKIYLNPELITFIKSLNGLDTVEELIEKLNLDQHKVLSLIQFMEENCLIQSSNIGNFIAMNKYSHILNFLADYIPYSNLQTEFTKLQNSHVVIIGLGAVGSWTAIELAKTGIENFTLIDTDSVEKSNLNRSFFNIDDIGLKKVIATKNNLLKINDKITCSIEDVLLDSSDLIENIIQDIDSANILVINCADIPNVDTTSSWINKACLNTNTPYIIAGGYNLHLTLLGPTIIPFETACFDCIQFQLNYEDKLDDMLRSKKLHRINRNIGNIAPMATITSTFVVNEAIRSLLKSNNIYPIMINRRGNINFFNNKIKFFDFNRMPTCKYCSNQYNSTIENVDKFIEEFYNQAKKYDFIIKNTKIYCKNNKIIIKEDLLKLLLHLDNNLSNYNSLILEKCNIDQSCSKIIEYIFAKTFQVYNK